jgi:hypothetical protein
MRKLKVYCVTTVVKEEDRPKMNPKKPWVIQAYYAAAVSNKKELADLLNSSLHFVSYHTLKLCGFPIHRNSLTLPSRTQRAEANFSTGLESLRTIGTKNVCANIRNKINKSKFFMKNLSLFIPAIHPQAEARGFLAGKFVNTYASEGGNEDVVKKAMSDPHKLIFIETV